jgi:hypothetical protein
MQSSLYFHAGRTYGLNGVLRATSDDDSYDVDSGGL